MSDSNRVLKPHRAPTARRRRGVSLLEVLLVVAILGVLLGLLLPAISAARNSARTLTCRIQLHNLSLAVFQYHDVHGVTPPLSYVTSDSQMGWSRLVPFLTDVQNDVPTTVAVARIGFDEPRSYKNLKYFVPAARYFVCPSASFAGARTGHELIFDDPQWNRHEWPGPGPCSYVMNVGANSRTLGDAELGLFSWYGVRLRAATAGLSKVALLSEVVANITRTTADFVSVPQPPGRAGDVYQIRSPADGRLGSFARDCEQLGRRTDLPSDSADSLGRTWWAANNKDSLYCHALTPGKISCEEVVINGVPQLFAVTTAGSEHDDLVNVAMADGSISGWSYQVDADLWRRTGHRHGENVF